MNRQIIKRYKWLFLLALVAFVVFFFFYRLYHRDVKALTDFSVAYEKFDKAISDFSAPLFALNLEEVPTYDSERQADKALGELNRKASARISSLIKNDAEFMRITLEIAELSGKELDTLRAYKKAATDKAADLDRLAKELGDLKIKRQTSYARFWELAGPKD